VVVITSKHICVFMTSYQTTYDHISLKFCLKRVWCCTALPLFI